MELDITDDDIKLFKMCKERWGREYQLNKLLEELGEAVSALSRFKNREVEEATHEKVNEELADVILMITQYAWMDNQGEQIHQFIKQKQIRTWNLLGLRPEQVTLTHSDLIKGD